MSAPVPEMISIREFARRDGCNDKLVRNAIRDGHLIAVDGNKLDAIQVGTGWRLSNRRGADTTAETTADKVRTPAEKCGQSAPDVSAVSASAASLEATAERILQATGAAWSQAEAERVKENYLALLRQLEYEQKSRQVAMVADVAEVVGQEYARVRTKLLAIPAEHAPQLSRITHPAQMQEALRKLIERALSDLSKDGQDGTDV